MPKTIDFDAFRAEQKQEKVSLKIGGKRYDMPTSIPATLALDIIRLQQAQGDESDVKPEDLMRVGAGLFGGEDVFRTVLEAGKVTLDELPELMKFVIAEYTGAVAGEAPARK